MPPVVDKKTADVLLAKCREALKQVLEGEGFELSKLSGKYGDSFALSISAIPAVRNELGLNPNAQEVVDFQRYHEVFKLPSTALGARFTVGKKHYQLAGLAVNRRKYPLVVLQDGKKMLLTDTPAVIQAITQAVQAAPQPAAPAPASPPKKAGRRPA